MAEDYAPLLRSVWNDEDFKALTSAAQHLYWVLLSWPARNSAGLVPLLPRKWSRVANGLTLQSVDESLAELDDTGFLVVDMHTDEVLVRSFIRRAKVYKHIRTLAKALREIEEVESERLKSAIGQELKRLPKLVIPNNELMKAEAEAAQIRLDELGSMLCDARPEPAGQQPVHPMGHGMAHGMGQGLITSTGAGTGAGVGTGAVLGSSFSSRSNSLESNAGARGLTAVVGGRWTA